MAIYRPKTIGDAPEGPQRSGGCRRSDPRLCGGLLSCLARNGRSPGEESRFDGVAAQTIEAQPVFGQIEPSQRPGGRALNDKPGRRWRSSVRQGKRTLRFGVGKETKEDKSEVVGAKPTANDNSRTASMYTGRNQTLPHRSAPRKAATISRSSSLQRLRGFQPISLSNGWRRIISDGLRL